MDRKLNLGSGFRPRKQNEGWINIDIEEECMPDIVRDVRKGLPFDDNSVDYVYASHFMEHFEWEDFIFLMSEIWRVLKPEATFEMIIPHYKHENAFDIDHKIVITPRTFRVFQRGLKATSSYKHFNNNKVYFKKAEIFDDFDGTRGEPQLYCKFKADK